MDAARGFPLIGAGMLLCRTRFALVQPCGRAIFVRLPPQSKNFESRGCPSATAPRRGSVIVQGNQAPQELDLFTGGSLATDDFRSVGVERRWRRGLERLGGDGHCSTQKGRFLAAA